MREIRVPFQFDVTGSVAFVDGEVAATQQHLVSLIATNPGERVMRPTYGVNTRAQLFESNDALAMEELRHGIRTQAGYYEPNAEVVQVQGDSRFSELDLTVYWRLRSSLNPDQAPTRTVIQLGGESEEFRG